jgi:DNA polymerase III delta subunit
MSPDMMSKHLSLSPFVVRKLQPLAQNYPVDELLWAQNLLTDTEFFVKSGQIPEEGSLEQAVYRLLAKRMKEQVS